MQIEQKTKSKHAIKVLSTCMHITGTPCLKLGDLTYYSNDPISITFMFLANMILIQCKKNGENLIHLAVWD